jgi:hypothetical protein
VDRAALDALAVQQCDVLTREQLRQVGFLSKHVARRLRQGLWVEYGDHVVALHNGPLTTEQRWWVAVLSCGSPAALASESALRAAGVTLLGGDDTVHVVISRGGRGSDLGWVKVHESRRFTAADIHPARRPPAVRLERAAVDAAAWAATDRRACGLLLAVVQQRMTTPGRLAAALRTAGSLRRRPLLARVLLDAAGGAQALTEVDFARMCRRHGLPLPERQVVRVDRFGKRRWLDAALRGPDGRLVIAEIDGAVHLLPMTYWDDMARGNEVAISGERLLRFPSIAIYLDEAAVADQLHRALGMTVDLSGGGSRRAALPA